jgi:hypothetical protein
MCLVLLAEMYSLINIFKFKLLAGVKNLLNYFVQSYFLMTCLRLWQTDNAVKVSAVVNCESCQNTFSYIFKRRAKETQLYSMPLAHTFFS